MKRLLGAWWPERARGSQSRAAGLDKCSVATEKYVRVWEAWTTTHFIEGVLNSFEAQEKILRISWMRRP